jgi:hypothetical protein
MVAPKQRSQYSSKDFSERTKIELLRAVKQYGRETVIKYVKSLQIKPPKPPGAPEQKKLRWLALLALYHSRRWKSISQCAEEIDATFRFGEWRRTGRPRPITETKGAIEEDLRRALAHAKENADFAYESEQFVSKFVQMLLRPDNIFRGNPPYPSMFSGLSASAPTVSLWVRDKTKLSDWVRAARRVSN